MPCLSSAHRRDTRPADYLAGIDGQASDSLFVEPQFWLQAGGHRDKADAVRAMWESTRLGPSIHQEIDECGRAGDGRGVRRIPASLRNSTQCHAACVRHGRGVHVHDLCKRLRNTGKKRPQGTQIRLARYPECGSRCAGFGDLDGCGSRAAVAQRRDQDHRGRHGQGAKRKSGRALTDPWPMRHAGLFQQPPGQCRKLRRRRLV